MYAGAVLLEECSTECAEWSEQDATCDDSLGRDECAEVVACDYFGFDAACGGGAFVGAVVVADGVPVDEPVARFGVELCLKLDGFDKLANDDAPS